MRRLALALRSVAPEDWIGLIGVILVTAFVGNRFGLDAAAGLVGLILVGLALLVAYARSPQT